MPTFGNPPGLLLLLALPLLLLFRRRRARPRRLLFTGAFLLEALARRAPRSTLQLLRLTRAQRLALVAAIVVCLSLALAETALLLPRVPPERWLVVVDNTPAAGAAVEGVPVGPALREALDAVTRGATAGDRVTVVTTSPGPSLRSFQPGAELAAHLAAIAPAARSASVETAAALAADLAPRHDRALLLSPRAGLWRRQLAGRPAASRLAIPPDRAVARGNRGIVLARLRASAVEAGRHDLYLVVRASGPAPGVLTLSLGQAGAPLPPALVALSGGEGRLFLEGLPLRPGALEVGIEGSDAFAGDDRVRLVLPGEEPVAVAVHGERAAVVAAAVGAHPGYTLAAPEGAQVDIRLGTAPAPLERPTLLVFPVGAQPGLTPRDLVPARGEPNWHPDHAVTRAMRGGSFRPSKVLALEAAAGLAGLAEVDGEPFLLAGERDGSRLLVWAFDPLADGLFARPEFVILLRESLDWLAGRSEIAAEPTPDAVTTADAAEVTLPRPDPAFFERPESAKRRIDLVPLLAAAALLLGFLLAAADAIAAGERA